MRLTMALILSMALMSGVGYWYYTDSQSRLGDLRESVAELSVVNERNQATINTMQVEAEANRIRIQNLQTNLQRAEEYGAELQRKLQQHNLTRLAEEKPGLIENRINDATNEVLDSIMRDTGSQ